MTSFKHVCCNSFGIWYMIYVSSASYKKCIDLLIELPNICASIEFPSVNSLHAEKFCIFLSSADIFQTCFFLNTIRLTNYMDSYKGRRFIVSGQGPKCFQRLLSSLADKELIINFYILYHHLD